MAEGGDLPPGQQEWGASALIARWRVLQQHRGSGGSGSAQLQLHAEATGHAPTLVVHPPELLVGVTLVLRGERTDEGVIIEAVSPMWRRFLNELARDPDTFWMLPPEQTEELVAGGYREDGWKVVLTPRSGDKGRDVIASRDDVGSIRILEQVKRYKPGHVVTAEEVRAMYGVLNFDTKASKAIVTTTSTFAPGVYTEFASTMPTRLELRNGAQLRAWLGQIVNGKRRK